jgi:hypothetical protein
MTSSHICCLSLLTVDHSSSAPVQAVPSLVDVMPTKHLAPRRFLNAFSTTTLCYVGLGVRGGEWRVLVLSRAALRLLVWCHWGLDVRDLADGGWLGRKTGTFRSFLVSLTLRLSTLPHRFSSSAHRS